MKGNCTNHNLELLEGWQKIFLWENFRPKMQNLKLKTQLWENLKVKLKFWAPIISSVGDCCVHQKISTSWPASIINPQCIWMLSDVMQTSGNWKHISSPAKSTSWTNKSSTAITISFTSHSPQPCPKSVFISAFHFSEILASWHWNQSTTENC